MREGRVVGGEDFADVGQPGGGRDGVADAGAGDETMHFAQLRCGGEGGA